jgi:hypothetical protein
MVANINRDFNYIRDAIKNRDTSNKKNLATAGMKASELMPQ